MKVLQINATYGIRSTGIIAKDINDMVEDNGGQAFFAYQLSNEISSNGYRVGNVIDWKLHAFFCRLTGKQAYFSKRATKRLIKYISHIKPDVVHLHNLHSNYIHLNLLLDFLAQQDIATVVTMHDCWYFTGKCFHYADVGCDKFMTGCGNCPKLKSPPRSLVFDFSKEVLKEKQEFLLKIPRLILVGCSNWICNETKKSFLKNIPIKQIYNGVNIDVFKPYDNTELKEKYNISSDTYVVLGMANKWLLPSNEKLLTEAVKILSKKTKLLIVGCNKEQIEDLKRLSEDIIPVGFIYDREELAKHYSLADVFVNATHVDTLPTVNMESICSGTPVITFDCAGSPELILTGCGSVIKENDIQSVINEINKKPKGIGEDNLLKARQTFDKKVCYKKYLDIYNEVLNRR